MVVGEDIAVTSDASGDATVYSGRTYNGYLHSIIYTKDDFADTVDFTITTESNINLWTEANVTASKTVHPRAASHSAAGVAATYDGTRAVLVPVAIAGERIKVVVANAGNATSGTFTVFVEGF